MLQTHTGTKRWLSRSGRGSAQDRQPLRPGTALPQRARSTGSPGLAEVEREARGLTDTHAGKTSLPSPFGHPLDGTGPTRVQPEKPFLLSGSA